MTFEYRPYALYDNEVDESRCRSSVADPGRGVHVYQCRRKAKYGGKWCHTHKPGAKEERIAETQARYDAKWKASCDAEERRALNHPAVVAQRRDLEEQIELLKRQPLG